MSSGNSSPSIHSYPDSPSASSSSSSSLSDRVVTGRAVRRRMLKMRRKIASLHRRVDDHARTIRRLRQELAEAQLELERDSERDRELSNASFRRGFEACKQEMKNHLGDGFDLSFLSL